MSNALIERLALGLARRTSRRGFLARTAVVSAAVAMDPVNYLLKPASAYESVCGSGASCRSGWTAFCVTVNNGVNTCPVGSFVAGWWKADNASVCGGKARYYVDCNASCVHGRHGHYTCSCRCAPGDTCDKRHTCCNQFRYGQCSQHVTCYGPVVCRVVSCVPPWQWADCSRSAATDNRTLSHSAPALPHHYDLIEKRYVALHGHASPLGASVHGRSAVGSGVMQQYQHGLLAWSPTTPVTMALATAPHYLGAGGPGGELGFPTHDESWSADRHGHLLHTQRGAVYASSAVAVHSAAGPWLPRWLQLVNDTSLAGSPVTSIEATTDGAGRTGRFAHGLLAWSSATAAALITGAAGARYDELGGTASALGYPTADTASLADGSGTLTHFQQGLIVVRPDGAWEVPGAAADYWLARGGPTSPLGYPSAAPAVVAGATETDFEHGIVFAIPDVGAIGVLPPIVDPYRSAGGAGGSLGLPTAEASANGTVTTQTFTGGTISYDSATATASIS